MSVKIGDGRYRLGRRLGHGGMATVFAAEDRQLRRQVAVKLLADNLAAEDDLRERFKREARLAARLAHPNVVQIFDVGDDEDRPWIVMELVDGESLATLADCAPLPAGDVAPLVAQAAAGLGHAHAAGLVHRDVKPQNLLLRRDGTLKIADFGIARAAEGTRLTQAGTVVGTGPYMAPEQAAGDEVSPETDLYALGVVTFELLTGRTPYEGPQPLAATWTEPVPSLSDLQPSVPDEFERIVLRCLQLDPGRRPASAAEVRETLDPTGRGSPLAPTAALAAATADSAGKTAVRDDPEEPPTIAVETEGGHVEPPTRQVLPVPGGLSARRLARGSRPWLAAIAAIALVALVIGWLDSGQEPATPSQPADRAQATRSQSAQRVRAPRVLADPAAQARELARWLRQNSR